MDEVSTAKVSTLTAANIRLARSLQLPTNVEYENPRVKEIAIKQEELFQKFEQLNAEMLALDEELLQISRNCKV